MGLNIKGKTVEVDPTHNQLLNTELVGNPTVKNIEDVPNGMLVYSTFQRQKTPNSLSRDVNIKAGDNCHLIYALKKKYGWRTTINTLVYLRRNFETISHAIKIEMDKTGPVGLIVAMPSGHWISKFYADRLGAIFSCQVAADVFTKITLDEARKQLAQSNLKSSEKRSVALRLKGDGPLSVKDIPTRHRHLFSAIVLANSPELANVKKILLVDDLLATGSTLIAARDILRTLAPDTAIDAACLFSAV